jgi:hypothetical protein
MVEKQVVWSKSSGAESGMIASKQWPLNKYLRINAFISIGAAQD